MPTTTTLTGYAAIEHAEKTNGMLNKRADPTEDAREGLDAEEAREIAAVDPSLIWLLVPSATNIAAAITAQMSDDDRATFSAEGWREGVSAMLVDEWASASLDDVLEAIAAGISPARRAD